MDKNISDRVLSLQVFDSPVVAGTRGHGDTGEGTLPPPERRPQRL